MQIIIKIWQKIQFWSLKGKDSSFDCQYYGNLIAEFSKLDNIQKDCIYISHFSTRLAKSQPFGFLIGIFSDFKFNVLIEVLIFICTMLIFISCYEFSFPPSLISYLLPILNTLKNLFNLLPFISLLVLNCFIALLVVILKSKTCTL